MSTYKKLGDLIIVNIKAGNDFLIFIHGYIYFLIQINMQYVFFCHNLGQVTFISYNLRLFRKEFHESTEFSLFQTLVERNAPNAEIENDVQ